MFGTARAASLEVPVAATVWGSALERRFCQMVGRGNARSGRWAIVFNGRSLRLWDAFKGWSRAFLEFDLETVIGDDAPFAVFWALARAEALASSTADVALASDRHGSSVRASLREGVREAVEVLSRDSRGCRRPPRRAGIRNRGGKPLRRRPSRSSTGCSSCSSPNRAASFRHGTLSSAAVTPRRACVRWRNATARTRACGSRCRRCGAWRTRAAGPETWWSLPSTAASSRRGRPPSPTQRGSTMTGWRRRLCRSRRRLARGGRERICVRAISASNSSGRSTRACSITSRAPGARRGAAAPSAQVVRHVLHAAGDDRLPGPAGARAAGGRPHARADPGAQGARPGHGQRGVPRGRVPLPGGSLRAGPRAASRSLPRGHDRRRACPLPPADRAALPLRHRHQPDGRSSGTAVTLAGHARGRQAPHLSRPPSGCWQQPRRRHAGRRRPPAARRPGTSPSRNSAAALSARRGGPCPDTRAAAAPPAGNGARRLGRRGSRKGVRVVPPS